MVWFPIPSMLFYIKKTKLYILISLARKFSSWLNEDLETFLSYSPRPKYYYIFLKGYRQGLVKKLNIV